MEDLLDDGGGQGARLDPLLPALPQPLQLGAVIGTAGVLELTVEPDLGHDAGQQLVDVRVDDHRCLDVLVPVLNGQ